MQDYGGYFRYAQDYYYSGNYESALEYANYALRYDPYNNENIYFKLQPHEVMQIEKRIIFPLKPANKLGRKIDF